MVKLWNIYVHAMCNLKKAKKRLFVCGQAVKFTTRLPVRNPGWIAIYSFIVAISHFDVLLLAVGQDSRLREALNDMLIVISMLKSSHPIRNTQNTAGKTPQLNYSSVKD
jgi:hypothetical protein